MADEIKIPVFRENRKTLQSIGLWPNDYKTFKNKSQIAFASLIGLMICVPAFFMDCMCLATAPFHIKIEQIALLSFHLLCTMRMVHWVIAMPSSTRLAVHLSRESFEFEHFYVCPLENAKKNHYTSSEYKYLIRKREELREMYEKFTNEAETIGMWVLRFFRSAAISIIFLFFGLTLIINVLFNEPADRRMPFNTYEPFNTNVTTNFIIISLQQASVDIYLTVAALGSEVHYLSLLIYFSKQCTIIGQFYEHIPINDFVPRRIAFKQFQRCVQESDEVLKSIAKLNNVIKFPIMIQDLLGVFFLCTMAFNFPYFNDFYQAIACVMVVIVIATEPLLLGWFSQSFTEDCLEISDYMYKMDWYVSEPKFRKMVVFSMARLQKPACITAGDFVRVDLNFFIYLIKTSYSIYTIISL